MKAQVYKDQRDAGFFMKYHEYARTHKPNWAYWLVRFILVPLSLTVFRLRVRGINNVPKSGGVILAPNHASFMDHFFVAALLKRKVRFAGKSQMFGSFMDHIYVNGGVFPVRRGWRDEEVFVTAQTLLENGEMVAWYTEGGRSRDGKFGKARPGMGRLALNSGVPVVPVAIYGSHQVRQWKRLHFPRITVKFGEPIVFEQNPEAGLREWQKVADTVLGNIQEEYSYLERIMKKPWLVLLFTR